MGVPVGEDSPNADWRQLVLVPKMSVREEERLRSRFENRVVAHHRELEHHLVNLGVAVAADRDDLVLAEVQHLRDLDGIVEVRHSVPRPVVEEVAQKDDLVIAERRRALERRLKSGRHTMDVAEEQDSHLQCSPSDASSCAGSPSSTEKS